jgi:hypothetical protein
VFIVLIIRYLNNKPMKHKIMILASDFITSAYINTSDCAVTRALSRAGLGDWYEGGGEIIQRGWSCRIATPPELDSKVLRMYKTVDVNTEKYGKHKSLAALWTAENEQLFEPLEPADFEFELELP